MISYEKNLIRSNNSLKEALKKLEETIFKCLIVVDKKNKLLGTITDGDIRRAILKGAKFDSLLRNYYFKNSVYFKNKIGPKISNLIKKNISLNSSDLIPIVDSRKRVINVVLQEEILKTKKFKYKNKIDSVPVVIIAGGKGSRLMPHTSIIPKPLIPINDKSMIEHVIERFKNYGSKNFFVTVNYKKELLRAFFSKALKKFNIKIINEKVPLGTAGSLELLKRNLKSSFFVINCDSIISCNYVSLYQFHKKNNFALTVVVSKKNSTIPYGLCEINAKGNLININEKPKIDFLANTGLYVLDPKVLKLIPKKKSFDMNNLIEKLLKRKNKLGVFPINEDDWNDLGNWSDLNKFIT
jgi:dTDP-glucose pyrophosphorylase